MNWYDKYLESSLSQQTRKKFSRRSWIFVVVFSFFSPDEAHGIIVAAGNVCSNYHTKCIFFE